MQEKGKWKKVLKTIGEVILGLFLLCFVAVVVIFTVDKVKEKGEWKVCHCVYNNQEVDLLTFLEEYSNQ